MTIQEFISKYEIWLPKNYRDDLKKQITDDLEVMFEALRQPHVSGMLPTDEEIINEAEGRYPVKTHNNPDSSPYVGTQKTFIHGVQWALAFVQGNYR